MSHSHSRSLEEARKSAQEFCQRTRPVCEIVMENDRLLGPDK